MLCLAALRRLAFERGKELELFNAGDYVMDAARELFGTDMPQDRVEQKLLDLPRSTVVQLRATAFERILHQIEARGSEHVVLSTHGCFRWNKALMRAFSIPHIDKFAPSVFFSVIDSPKRIYDVLSKNPVWSRRDLTPDEVATWQDEEVLLTRLLAGYRGREFLPFDRNSDVVKLYEFLFGREAHLSPIRSPGKSSYITAIVTAISGSWARRYLVGFTEWARKEKNREISLLDLPGKIVEVAQAADPSVNASNILDQPPKKLDEWRAKAFNEIAAERTTKGDCVVLTHATFRHTRTVTPAFNSFTEVDTLNLLGPTHFVTLLENILSCYVRIQTYLDWKRYNLSLIDVAIWRDEEAFMSKFIADLQGKPHYLIPAHVPYAVFWNFLFEKDSKKAYLSYPITQMLGHKQEKAFFEEKQSIYERLESQYALIDPFDVQDTLLFGVLTEEAPSPFPLPGHLFDLEDNKPVYRELKVNRGGADKFYVEYGGSRIEIETEKLKMLRKHVDDQIVERDYSIIDQSNAVFVYYPVTEGSPGVISEIIYAFSSGKDTFVYWKPRQSPFLKSVSNSPPGPFDTKEKFLDYLTKTYAMGR